ncbi:MAG: hypothetical protein AAFV53_12140 [Myxococcota bacterium]
MLLWLILAACSSDDHDSASAEEGTVTYYEDIKPLLATHCTRCHDEGGLGIGDFTDVDTVLTFAPAMSAAISEGRMPPPAADPGCQDYNGSDALTLSDDEKQTLVSWLDGDAPLGDPADEVEVAPVSSELSDPDLVLTIDQPYTPTFDDPDHPGNEYRCFVLEKPEDIGNFYITAMAPVVDAAPLAHHAVLFSVDSQTLATDYADGFNDGTGTPCFDDGNPVQGMITAWAPGMQPIAFPEGAGMLISASRTIILQMHYFYSGEDTAGMSDQTGYAFRIADAVDTSILMVPLTSTDFEIPAGDDDYTHTETITNELADLKVYGTFPHMHSLGQRFSATIEHTDGSETCLVEGEYDFDNQMTYQFTEPLDYARGDTVRFSCNWNNSTSNPDLPYDEPQTTYYGEETDEEMCFFFTYGSF